MGIPNYINMHKNQYKFTKKINKCDVTIKSTITKITISRKKKWLKQLKKKSQQKQNQNWRKRESIDLFVVDKLEGIGEGDGNEVRRNIYEN